MRCKTLFLCLFIFISFKASPQTMPASLALIPKPAQLTVDSLQFIISSQTSLVHSEKFENEEGLLINYLRENYQITLLLVENIPTKGKYIHLKQNKNITDSEAYHLTVNQQKIEIEAGATAGIFYGVQTLFQMLPVAGNITLRVTAVIIKDQPHYKWRGMHLDCCRHFFPVSFIKRYIDYIAMYKMNVFHWHLTDDQGWRIEIKQYPKLTTIGAWRDGSMVGHYRNHVFDSIRYGGYYTQQQIKELVAYAQQRHVTIVPEIEMPGHAVAALASYPEYSCSGKPVDVSKKWGVETNVFCPTEETFRFLENVLSEVMALFPSKFIHIGGDEVPKDEWNNSAYCKALMAKEHLKDAHELQGYFIKRIEKFVNSKGRQIIGWDEILEGGLAPNAAVMSWRGTEGGITAAKQKHYVVMTPGSHCYFDHYQGNPDSEPVAIGGYTPLEKVYSYEPTPVELNAVERKYIMGAQGNVWTEYINTPEDVEYMAMPRMAALAEVLWTDKNQKDFSDFISRLLVHFMLLDKMNVNYSKSIFELKATVKPGPDHQHIFYTLSTIGNKNGIKYTTDSTEPSLQSLSYTDPVLIEKNQQIKSAYFNKEKQISKTLTYDFTIHKAVSKTIKLTHDPSQNYSADGAFTLVNGIRGNLSRFDNNWLGFSGKNLEAIIDFGKSESFIKITFDFLNLTESWIHPPQKVLISVSDDGINFKDVKAISSDEIKKFTNTIVIQFNERIARYLKVQIQNIGIIPVGYPGAGNEANLFIDEIIVE